MISFTVPDMTCGHCVASITKAVVAADRGAQVHIELGEHRVDIETQTLTAERLRSVIEDLGFTPTAVGAL